ncbi:hypothetical protein BDZ94DRAFT_1344601 [Collybia nuda]|uniref:Protein F37C4.5 n=1 Tax=Collybia nuda TaxID=64659 RepID=A0A9P6CKV5_9AGAR|nr:hypothetical protein BDZ94DRAFT_1344601 [Collybia nuda]
MTEVSASSLFGPTSTIELTSLGSGKITNVSLYDHWAEITRLYKAHVKPVRNNLTINGLPNALDRNSLRVEGRGAATIHDVAILNMPRSPVQETSAILDGLLIKRESCQMALHRCKKSIKSLEGYLLSLNAQHTNTTQVEKVIETYDLTAGKIDERILELGSNIKDIDKEIALEHDRLAELGQTDPRLRMRALISIFAEVEGDIELVLTYAVHSANWSACYDIRADMQTTDAPITLTYKAAITQSTGEAWDNISLTLQTATPTFGIQIPSLLPWALSVYKPPTISINRKSGSRFLDLEAEVESEEEEEEDDDVDMDITGHDRAITHRASTVSSKGNVNATPEAPGEITIPSDGGVHNVTVAQLQLDTTMSWITVPKVDPKTHLKNNHEYTLLPGIASIYVDGSFISRTEIPLISPQDTFDQPLGLDPSIRVTYHPLHKKVSETGFYTKTSNYIFSQRITVFNTKASGIGNLKIVDQVPISEDAQITIKLLSPGLTIPEHPSSGQPRASTPVRVNDDVVAQWEGADEQGFDMAALGRDGKFYWMCSIPAKGKITLFLSWEVNAPIRTQIAGL